MPTYRMPFESGKNLFMRFNSEKFFEIFRLMPY